MYKLLSILLFAFGLAAMTEDIYDNSWALIIGINKYENVQKLAFATDDAIAMKEILISSFNFPENNIFILLLIGPIAYLPAMAIGDSTLDLDDETRIKRLGILWLAFSVFMLFMMAPVVDMAMEGEWAEESPDGNTYEMSIDSTSQTIAMGALGLGVAGILVFLMTAVMGMELGPMRPFHGGAMAASTMIIAQYLVLMADGGPAFDIADMPFIIGLVGLIGLPPYIAYEGANSD